MSGLPRALAVPADARLDLRVVRVDPARRGLDRVRAGPQLVGARARPSRREAPLALPRPGSERRPERPRATRADGSSAQPTRACSRSTARTGRKLWTRKLTNSHEQFIDIAPLAARGLVFTSTVGFPPGGRGALYALDQRTGKIRWRFETIRDPWQFPSAGGGGAWYPPSLAPDGRLYFGISNPGPWGGSPVRPNGGMYPGPVPYTDALLALTAATGKLLWYDQVTKHDVRDYDLEASPIVVGRRVFGAGKAGRVVAWDRLTGARLLVAGGRHAPARPRPAAAASRRSSAPDSGAAC